MKPTVISLALALLATSVSAQNLSVPPMKYLDVTRDGTSDVAAIWADKIQANNAAWRAQGSAMPPGNGNAPSGILWQRYERNGDTITLSIFHGLGSVTGCDAGADDKDNQQSWAMCPARITVRGPSGQKNTQTTACYQWFPLGPGQEPPAGERSYATVDVSGTQANFSATQDGRPVPACNRNVRIVR
jgi:hypothetical protein